MTKEKIIEVAKKAGFFVNSKMIVTSPFAEDVCIYYLLEGFAKLLVKECIDIVDDGGEFASRSNLVEKLQNHFGVKE